MKKIVIILAFSLLKNLYAQLPETDIFLCSIKKDSTNYIFSKPENITNRPGYENQPYFTPDGNKILYVVADSQQTDIFSYNIQAEINLQFTETAESEYSPAYTPNRKFVSVVRVDADSGQRFYSIPLNDLKNPQLIINTDSIGYACWLNDSSLAMFILGPANTLQLLNTITHERKLIASDIGRCLKLSPDGTKMFFVLKSNPSEWYIYSLDCIDHILKRVASTLPHSEDFAIMPDGNLIMGSEGKLFLLENTSGWKMIADFSVYLKDFYRLAVNKDGTLLALVAFSGKKP
jgi:Tol biopolymer transport system component